MSSRYPFAQGIAFFAGFFIIALALEAGLLAAMAALFNARLVPRGLGWLMFPIAAGLTGWAFGREIGLEKLLAGAQAKLLGVTDRRLRGLIAASLLWSGLVIAVFIVFDPFQRYRWQGDEWIKFIFILVSVPVLLTVGIYLFDWVTKNQSIESTSQAESNPVKYRPTDNVFETLLWSLIALSVAQENSEAKIRWIEVFHEKLRGVSIERRAILDIAERFKKNGPQRMLDILRDRRGSMSVSDGEFLIKAACLLSSVEGRMSKTEREMILQFVDVLGINQDRLKEL